MKIRKHINQKNILYGLILLAILFCFLTMGYSDIGTISNLDYMFVDSIFKGTFQEFYNAMTWSYGVTIDCLFAIWSLPLWIVNKIMGISGYQNTAPVYLWYKLFVSLFAVWSVYLVDKIITEFAMDERESARIQYLSAFLFVIPVFAIAQVDIIGLCFVLLGIYAYMKNQDVKFLIFFAIAMTMKYFAVIVFIPLVLFRYRKLKKMFIVFIVGISLILLSLTLVHGSTSVSAASQDETFFVNQQIVKFASVVLDTGERGQIGILGFVYTIICVLAYTVKKDNADNNKKLIVWFATAAYMCFFLFYPCNVYWYVLLAPCMVLLTYSNKSKIKINIILESIFSICTIVIFCFTQDWVAFGKVMFSFLGLKKYAPAVQMNALQYFLEHVFHFKLIEYIPIFNGVVWACGILLLVINFPGLKCFSTSDQQSDAEEKSEIRILMWMRVIVVYLIIMISVYCLVDSQKGFYFTETATIDFVPEDEQIPDSDNKIVADHCSYIGNAEFIDGDAWMKDEFTTILHSKNALDKDVKFSVYGYTVSGKTPVSVYVNDEFIGTLEKEDETQNLTNRYIIIPGSYFKSYEDVAVKITAEPEMIARDELPISITINKIQVTVVE